MLGIFALREGLNIRGFRRVFPCWPELGCSCCTVRRRFGTGMRRCLKRLRPTMETLGGNQNSRPT